MSSKKALDLIRGVALSFANGRSHDAVLKNITITSAGGGKCCAEFKVQPEHLNRMGGLHGGFTATVVDNFTTFALVTDEKPPGVTVDLHVSYMRSAREGDEVIIDANTVRAGKRLAYLECELRHKKDGTIIAKGSQTKFLGS